MRLALFEVSGISYSIFLDKVLHILTEPHVFRLPLLRACFSGMFIHHGKVVPLLACEPSEGGDGKVNSAPAFVLVCEAEFGLLGVPADRVVRITKIEEVDAEAMSGFDMHGGMCEISGSSYRLLDLNGIVEDPDFRWAD